MGNFLQEAFRTVVYEPELNILFGFFKLTNDIGFSIVLLSFAVNLIILPLFAKNYIGLQKSRILQPKIKEIQTKYKKDPQVMLAKMREFNKLHGINNGYTFLVLFIQLFFISGLFFVIQDVVKGSELKGIYQLFFGPDVANYKFSTDTALAFGTVNIGARAAEYLWMPLATLFIMYLNGMYTFRWSPQIKLPKPKVDPKKKKSEPDALDPEVMQKAMEFQTIYMLPVISFIFNYSVPMGLNIYFITSSVISLVRQIFLTRYYASHTDKLMMDIADSDPTSKDNNPDNNIELTGDPAQLVQNIPVAELVLPAKSIPSLDKKAKKKPVKKSNKKKGK